MGQLAFGIVGGVVGAFFGVPQLGFLAGSLIGGFLFPAKGPNQSGPKLDNLAVTSSTYGQPIFIIYGTCRVGGNIIWGPPIRETSHTQKQSAKGGMGGGGKTTTYTYSWTGAVAICEGPIDGIIRIWADTKIVYDASGTSPNTKKPSFRFRIYKGTEDQLPDPAIEADVGADNATAHRGLAYIVFDDIQLSDFGNRIPSWTFEVVADTGSPNQSGVVGIINQTGGSFSSPTVGVLLPDWKRQRLYRFNTTSIHAYTIAGAEEVGRITSTDSLDPDNDFSISNGGQVAVDDDGYIYAQINGGNSAPLVKIDGISLKEVGRVGSLSSNLDPGLNVISSYNMFCVNAYNATAQTRFLINVSQFDTMQVIHTPSFGRIGFERVDESRTYGCGGEANQGVAVVYLIGHDFVGGKVTTDIGIYKAEITATAHLTYYVDADGGIRTNRGITMTKLGTLSPSSIIPWWTHWTRLGSMFYDTHEGRLYFIVQGSRLYTTDTVQLVRYNIDTAAVERVTEITVTYSLAANNAFYNISDGFVSFVGQDTISTSSVQTINLVTGTSEVTTGWDHLQAVGGGQVYSSSIGGIISVGTTGNVTGETTCILYTNRASKTGVTDGDIVADLCDRAGLDPADYDVTALTHPVPGYIINSQMTARAGIEPLALAFQFDGVESDDKIKFRTRGQALSITLVQDDLVFVSDGEVLQETRTQEVELPERISLVYLDRENDYQQNTMTAKRISLPTPSMYSRNQVTNTLPMVLQATSVKQIADTLLYASWTERIQTSFSTGWKFLATDPVDTFKINLDNGTSYTIRVISVDVGANWSMQFKAVNSDATLYTSTIVGDGGQGFPQQLPPGPTATKTFLLDSPLLRDIDDAGGVASRLYCCGGGFGSTNWPGELIEKSADGSLYSDVATVKTQVSWGAMISPLGSPTDPFINDEINTIQVRMVTGDDQLESVTQLEMVNGANAACILNADTGVLEIIQFRDVAQSVDGTFTLSGLLRGRRGTDVYCTTHTAGEFFLLLQLAPIETFTQSIGDLNHERFYKGVPYGTFQEDADLITLTATGRDLKPYAPTSVTATLSAGDINLAWQRRSRVAGDLQDATGTIPLGETTEAYEIDIYSGSTILRTLTATTNAKTYTSANVVTDFGSPPATLKLAVYQMSEAIGRGFAYIQTVVVA